jgi:hypothetical protein
MTPECRRPERSRRIPGLPAWLEAARVRQKAKIFQELNHDTYKIAPLPANARLRAAPANRRRFWRTTKPPSATGPTPLGRMLVRRLHSARRACKNASANENDTQERDRLHAASMPDRALMDINNPARHFHLDAEVSDTIKHLLVASRGCLLLPYPCCCLILSSAV